MVLKLKRVYSTIEYDPMYLFSILLNASIRLRSETGPSNVQKIERSNERMPKESVLLSAEPRMSFFVDWPENFKRKT